MYEEKCGYFDDKTAQVEIYLLPDENECKDMYEAPEDADGEFLQELYYESLLENGYRRSGKFIYLNLCPSCKKCIPIRINTDAFELSKSQRHVLKKNADIEMKVETDLEKMITDEKVILFKNYFKRHGEDLGEETNFQDIKESLMELNGISEVDGKLTAEFSGICNLDYYLNGKLIGVSVLDFCVHSISSNYFYYDISPEIMKRGIGTFSIINEILCCRRMNKKYYYLGYYLKECRKMNYKANFKPFELMIGNKWKNHTHCTEEEMTGIPESVQLTEGSESFENND